jgi:hypothetical protein
MSVPDREADENVVFTGEMSSFPTHVPYAFSKQVVRLPDHGAAYGN